LDQAAVLARRLLAAAPPAQRGGPVRSHDLGNLRWDRLPGTAAEADAIAPKLKLYAGKAPKVYKGKEALEDVFKDRQRTQPPRVLVLGTHGFFLEGQADAEAPLLAEGNGRGMKVLASALAQPAARPRPRAAVKLAENPLERCGLALAGANN